MIDIIDITLPIYFLLLAIYPFLAKRKGIRFWQVQFVWRYIFWLPALFFSPLIVAGIISSMIDPGYNGPGLFIFIYGSQILALGIVVYLGYLLMRNRAIKAVM